MYWLIEREEQLEEFKNKGYDKVFIEPIYFNDNIHPLLNSLSLIYIRALKQGEKGYMICINHDEATSVDPEKVYSLLSNYKKIYIRDRKSFINYFPFKNLIYIFDQKDYTTKTQEYFYQQHPSKLDINLIIPLVKHYEKCELIFDYIKDNCNHEQTPYDNKLSTVFASIENNGILINNKTFDKYFTPINKVFSIRDNTVYTQYNLCTTTGRPSNAFNGINFAALKKDDGSRAAFIPKNDYFVEIDINAYHPTLLGKLINFDFGDETPYEYFARESGIKLADAKVLLIKQLYGGVYKEYKDIEYLKLVDKFVKELWEKFNNDGFVECSISNYRFYKDKLTDMNPQKLLSYVIQNLETATNVNILWDIIKLLRGKKSQIVLYTYDSILIDYHKDDKIIKQILKIFTNNKLKTKVTVGENYNEMEIIQN